MRSTASILILTPMVALGLGCERRITVKVDGSSTVFPITEAVAEQFQKEFPDIFVTVGFSGTGGGFKKFCLGETDINDASRPIKETEGGRANENGIDFIELPIALDGISVVVHPENKFAGSLSPEDLKRIWRPESKVKRWKDVRSDWPDRVIKLYGPGTASGTFDYFTEAINGKSQACRPDFMQSEDDNVLVHGISGDPDSLGFFGYAYYIENRDKLNVVAITGKHGPVEPTEATINDGSYQPLSRPIFIYVSVQAAERPEVQKFVDFYLEHAPKLVSGVGYIPLPDRVYQLARDRFAKRVTGSVFRHRQPGEDLEEAMMRPAGE